MLVFGGVLLAQAWISVAPWFGLDLVGTRRYGDEHWPIVDYPMYSKALKREGDPISVRRIVEVRYEDGEVVEVAAEDLGVSFFQFRAVSYELGYHARPRQMVMDEVIQAAGVDNKEVAAIDVRHYPLIITRDGPKEVPQGELIRSVDLPGPSEAEASQ